MGACNRINIVFVIPLCIWISFDEFILFKSNSAYFIQSWTALWLSLSLLLLDNVICFIKYIMKFKCQTCSKNHRLLLRWKCFRNEHTLFGVVICLGWGHIVLIIRKRIATRNNKKRERGGLALKPYGKCTFIKQIYSSSCHRSKERKAFKAW